MNTHRKGLRILSALVLLTVLVSVCAAAFAYDTIRFGEESMAVRDLQKALKSKGYFKGTVDGVYGQKTQSAVYRYQKAIGIHADGKAGDKTLTALYEGVKALNRVDKKKAAGIVTKDPDTLYYGSSGSSVKSLQRMLRKAGYFKSSADGVFGDTTLVAVKRFQWAHGLHGDGLAGSKTMRALKKAIAK